MAPPISLSLLVVDADTEILARAQTLAQGLGCTVVTDAGAISGDLALRLSSQRLELLDLSGPKPVAVWADFIAGRFGYRLRQGYGRRQPLGRAVGVGNNARPRIVDCTAGLGRDSALLAALGCPVIALERSAVVAELLADGLSRARESGADLGASAADARVAEAIGRIQLIRADARQWLRTQSATQPADVVLLDPMFPERQKAALVKKEMRLFKHLVGEDFDSEELLEAALTSSIPRVVVKRPRGSPPMPGSRKPSHSHDAGVTRFDVYL